MPLPKLPTRPAAILDVADLKLEPPTSAAAPIAVAEMVYEEVTEPSRAPAALAPEAARLEKPSKSIMLDLSEL